MVHIVCAAKIKATPSSLYNLFIDDGVTPLYFTGVSRSTTIAHFHYPASKAPTGHTLRKAGLGRSWLRTS